jgi:chemotaxis protein CheD
MGDMQSTSEADAQIITYALGSCLGIAVYDPFAGVGGLLHVMLPAATLNPQGRGNPCKYVDTGVPRLFRSCYALGARKERLIVKVAGGASREEDVEQDYFQIGRRNFRALKQLLWKNNVLLSAADVGGTASRTMVLDLNTGQVLLKSNGAETLL